VEDGRVTSNGGSNTEEGGTKSKFELSLTFCVIEATKLEDVAKFEGIKLPLSQLLPL
jgi:hypothetical protein